MPRVEFTGGFYEDSALQFDSQRCVNMYPEVGSGSSKSTAKLSYSSGYIAKDVIEFSPILYSDPEKIAPLSIFSTSNGYLLWTATAVETSGDVRLYIRFLDPDGLTYGTSVVTGFTNNSIPIKMAENNNVVSVVVTDELTGDSEGYFVDLQSVQGPTVSVVKITDADFPNYIVDQVYHDTYFIWLTQPESEEGRFYISGSNLEMGDVADVVNPLDFGTAENSPDKCVGIEVLSNEVCIFGGDTIQYFYNSGNVDFPYESNQGATQNIGTLISRSIKKVNNILFFIGSDENGANVVYMMNGYNIQRVSNHAIERRLNYLAEVDYSSYLKTECYTYQLDGHYFYCVKYQKTSNQTRYDSSTFVYDMSNGLWHENTFLNGSIEESIPIEDTANYNGITYGISSTDLVSGVFAIGAINLYSFSKESFKLPLYNGEESIGEFDIPRKRILPHISSENKNIQINYFEMDIQKGVGNVDDPNPIITLSVSRDGGMTYGNPITMTMGASGDYKQRARIDMLGMGRDFVFKLESESPVQQEWFIAYIDYEVMNE